MVRESFFIFGLLVSSVAIVAYAIRSWLRFKRDRLRVLEEALRNDSLDAEVKREIVRGLSGPRMPMRPLFGLGWLMMFVGAGLLFMDERDTFAGGVVTLFIGIALVTLPMAIREMDARKQA